MSEHLSARIVDVRMQFGLRGRNHMNGGGARCHTPWWPRLTFGANERPKSDTGPSAASEQRKTNQSDTLIGSLALDDLKTHTSISF